MMLVVEDRNLNHGEVSLSKRLEKYDSCLIEDRLRESREQIIPSLESLRPNMLASS